MAILASPFTPFLPTAFLEVTERCPSGLSFFVTGLSRKWGLTYVDT